MEFHLRHGREMSAALLQMHPVWAQYHEPADIDVIVGWGVPREVVEAALELVDWSDSYLFPVLRPEDAARFYSYHAATLFRTAGGVSLEGFVSNSVPSGAWFFDVGGHLYLSAEYPEVTEDDERVLQASLDGGPIYPLEILSCALPLQRKVLDPYAA